MMKEKEVDNALLTCPFCNNPVNIVASRDMGSERPHIRCLHCPITLGTIWGDAETRETFKELNILRKAIYDERNRL